MTKLEKNLTREEYNLIVRNLEDKDIVIHLKAEKYCGGNVSHGGGVYGISTNEGHGTLILISNIHNSPSLVIGSDNLKVVDSIRRTIENILENGK